MICREWRFVDTPDAGLIDTYVAAEDFAALPPAAHGALRTAVVRVVAAVKAMEYVPVDDDAPDAFPNTTVEITVCLRPVRVLLVPVELWAVPSAGVH